MGRYTISAGEAELFKGSNTKDELMKKLGEVEKKYGDLLDLGDLPESLGLEKLDFRELSDEEMNRIAGEKLDGDYRRKLEELRVEYADKKKKLTASGTAAAEEGNELLRKLGENYASAKKNVEDSALSRGLARSSIAQGQIGALEEARSRGETEIESAVSRTRSEIDSRMEALSGELDRAIEDEDAAYAKRLAGEIRTLKTDQDKKRTDALKYNNTVAEKEVEYSADRKRKAVEALEKAVSGETAEKRQKMKGLEQARILRDFFDKMPVDAALAYLANDPDIKNAAGEYYNYLYSYLKLKEE